MFKKPNNEKKGCTHYFVLQKKVSKFDYKFKCKLCDEIDITQVRRLPDPFASEEKQLEQLASTERCFGRNYHRS